MMTRSHEQLFVYASSAALLLLLLVLPSTIAAEAALADGVDMLNSSVHVFEPAMLPEPTDRMSFENSIKAHLNFIDAFDHAYIDAWKNHAKLEQAQSEFRSECLGAGRQALLMSKVDSNLSESIRQWYLNKADDQMNTLSKMHERMTQLIDRNPMLMKTLSLKRIAYVMNLSQRDANMWKWAVEEAELVSSMTNGTTSLLQGKYMHALSVLSKQLPLLSNAYSEEAENIPDEDNVEQKVDEQIPALSKVEIRQGPKLTRDLNKLKEVNGRLKKMVMRPDHAGDHLHPLQEFLQFHRHIVLRFHQQFEKFWKAHASLEASQATLVKEIKAAIKLDEKIEYEESMLLSIAERLDSQLLESLANKSLILQAKSQLNKLSKANRKMAKRQQELIARYHALRSLRAIITGVLVSSIVDVEPLAEKAAAKMCSLNSQDVVANLMSMYERVSLELKQQTDRLTLTLEPEQ